MKPLTAIVMASLLKSQLEGVNMVNAASIAESRGIKISETKSGSQKDFRSLINVTVTSETRTRNVSGTLFTGKEPRIVNIEGVPVEAALGRHMLFIRNEDKPGLVGGVGMILGSAKQNIADFRLGRREGASEAVCIVSLDAPLPDAVFAEIAKLPHITSLKRLSFA